MSDLVRRIRVAARDQEVSVCVGCEREEGPLCADCEETLRHLDEMLGFPEWREEGT